MGQPPSPVLRPAHLAKHARVVAGVFEVLREKLFPQRNAPRRVPVARGKAWLSERLWKGQGRRVPLVSRT